MVSRRVLAFITFFRIFLFIFFSIFLGWDLIKIIHTNNFVLTSIGEHWFLLDKKSIILSQSIVQRYIHYNLWDPIIITIIQIPTFFILFFFLLISLLKKNKKKSKKWFK